MASIPRYLILPDKAHFHITWQCHDRDFLLKPDWAKEKYFNLLLKYKSKYNIKILSFCFMSNHPHLVGYADIKENVSLFFKTVNSQFALYVNKRKKREGQVVMRRFHSSIIEGESSLLKVMTYVDLNPKRASLVSHPKDYKWSSYRHYAYGENSLLIDDEPECYTNLGSTPEERQKRYQEMVQYILDHDWKDKKNYSKEKFIGNPEWVTERYYELKNQLKQQKSLKVPKSNETCETIADP